MISKLIGSPWALLALGILVLSVVGGLYMKGRADGAGAERNRWEVKVEQARLQRDEERREAAEALSMQALEHAEQEAVLRDAAAVARAELRRVIAENPAVANTPIPDAMLDPLRRHQ